MRLLCDNAVTLNRRVLNKLNLVLTFVLFRQVASAAQLASGMELSVLQLPDTPSLMSRSKRQQPDSDELVQPEGLLSILWHGACIPSNKKKKKNQVEGNI